MNSTNETARKLISFAETRFKSADLYYGHGTDNAYDEAAYLVLRSLNMDFDAPDQELDSIVSPEKSSRVQQLVDQRIEKRIPVAYLLNEAWFAGLPFYVDKRVLIPRSPIAELIEEQFTPWVEPGMVKKVLDIGTGSACIAVACAGAFHDAIIDAIDTSPDALDVAGINIERYQVGDRIQLYQSDLYEKLAGKKYDLIVANPPYVSDEEIKTLPAEYHHEPISGLQAGMDGLDVVKRIIEQSGKYLNEHGVLIVEVGNSQDKVMQVFPQTPFTWLEFARGGEGVFLLNAEDLPSTVY